MVSAAVASNLVAAVLVDVVVLAAAAVGGGVRSVVSLLSLLVATLTVVGTPKCALSSSTHGVAALGSYLGGRLPSEAASAEPHYVSTTKYASQHIIQCSLLWFKVYKTRNPEP